ncbi:MULTISPECIES: hypothetical protein [Rhizobium]|uniref:hypothetical protein n=1 Tax=Rhizobium TaxID=379 RepID=UPI000EAAA041|nr:MULTISPECIES: hypothetical protein [Rhizobium]AYG76797.1 hypothetical protein CCGE532_30185 [Rhizobium sp. CCGE532]MBB6305562.1 uncharacterized membrane protein YuzA (DUF378 family) [Rhizobium leucaenae]MDK4743190.1 hypothetical protein [Rhizobium sp. CNPSo 3464]
MSKTLSNLFVVVGGVGVVGSVFWWYSFYTQVSEFLGARGSLPSECIYTLGGACGMVSNAANTFGATAYDPKAFWLSIGILAVGVILRLIPDGNKDHLGYQQRPKHKDPSL